MQDWITCIHIQMPGFGKMPVPQKKLLYRNFLFRCCDLNFRTFFTEIQAVHNGSDLQTSYYLLYYARKEYCGNL